LSPAKKSRLKVLPAFSNKKGHANFPMGMT